MIVEYWQSDIDVGGLGIYETHQRLWGFFPRLPDGVRPFLWLRDGDIAIMRSSMAPNRESFHIRIGINKNERIRVFVRCNPTRTETLEDGSKKKRSIVKHDDLVEWFRRKGDDHGFSPMSEIETSNMGAVRWNGPRGRKFVVGCMEITGWIVVTDEKKFTEMYLNGIGRTRAFGFGMMLIIDGDPVPWLEVVK